MSSPSSQYLRRIRPVESPSMRLICLPHAGGSATAFSTLARQITTDLEVISVQYPGRQDRRRDPFVPTVIELAERVADAVAEIAGLPYAFLGHSMGAVVGFEASRRLEVAGTGPVRLFASGRRAPSTSRPGPLVHEGGDEALLDELRKLSGTDARLLADPDVVAMILPPMRNDYRAIETYRLTDETPLSCPISVLVGDVDPQVTADEAAAWSRHTTGGHELRQFPGGHFYLDANAAAVAAHVTAVLAGATLPTPA